MRIGVAPSNSKVRRWISLGSTRIFMPFMSAGMMYRPQPIGDVAEAVLEPAEDAVVDALLGLAREVPPERAVHRRARLSVVGEQERQIDEAEFRHTVGQITRRLIAERDLAVLDQRQNVLGLVAVIHDVADVFDRDAVAELRFKLVADEFQRLAEAGRRRAVAAHDGS